MAVGLFRSRCSPHLTVDCGAPSGLPAGGEVASDSSRVPHVDPRRARPPNTSGGTLRSGPSSKRRCSSMASTRTPSSLTTRRAICSRTSNSTARRAGTPWRPRRSAGAGGGTCARSCRRTRTTRRSRGHCARSFTSSEGNDDADCGPLETGRPEGLRYRRDRCVCPRGAGRCRQARRTFRNCTDRTRCRHRPPNGVSEQPARPRCQGATPFLANPGGPARRDAVGVPDPRGGQRTGSRAQGRHALGLRTRRLGSVHRRRLRGPGAPVVATLLLASPRLGRDGRCLSVERDRMVGDGAAGAVRLDRAVDRTGERARSVGAIAIAPVCGASSRSTATSSRRAPTSRATGCTSSISTDAASAISSSRRAGPATTTTCSTRPTTSRRC